MKGKTMNWLAKVLKVFVCVAAILAGCAGLALAAGEQGGRVVPLLRPGLTYELKAAGCDFGWLFETMQINGIRTEELRRLRRGRPITLPPNCDQEQPPAVQAYLSRDIMRDDMQRAREAAVYRTAAASGVSPGAAGADAGSPAVPAASGFQPSGSAMSLHQTVRLAQAEQQLREAEEKIAGLENQIQAGAARADKAEASAKDFEARLQAEAARAERAEDRVSELEGEVNNLQRQLNVESSRAWEAEQRVKELEQELQRLEAGGGGEKAVLKLPQDGGPAPPAAPPPDSAAAAGSGEAVLWDQFPLWAQAGLGLLLLGVLGWMAGAVYVQLPRGWEWWRRVRRRLSGRRSRPAAPRRRYQTPVIVTTEASASAYTTETQTAAGR
jgi:TolA-binding protein